MPLCQLGAVIRPLGISGLAAAVGPPADDEIVPSAGRMLMLPGGVPAKLSGTSMAAPQVANLAAKLLAVNPDLTTEQLLKAITSGADARTEQGVALIHPKKSLQLVAGM